MGLCYSKPNLPLISPKDTTTQQSLFEIVYGQNPNNLLDLVPIPNVGGWRCGADELVERIINL